MFACKVNIIIKNYYTTYPKEFSVDDRCIMHKMLVAITKIKYFIKYYCENYKMKICFLHYLKEMFTGKFYFLQ